MAKKTRIKSTSSPAFVPQSLPEVSAAIHEIGEVQREIIRLETEMNDELAAVKESWEARAKPLQERINTLSQGVEIYCHANRDTLTRGGKVKTAVLTTGEVSWRTSPPSVRITGQEAVLDLLRRLGLGRFIRVKEEVNKEAILNEPEAVVTIPGIKINQTESFVITPFESEISESGV